MTRTLARLSKRWNVRAPTTPNKSRKSWSCEVIQIVKTVKSYDNATASHKTEHKPNITVGKMRGMRFNHVKQTIYYKWWSSNCKEVHEAVWNYMPLDKDVVDENIPVWCQQAVAMLWAEWIQNLQLLRTISHDHCYMYWNYPLVIPKYTNRLNTLDHLKLWLRSLKYFQFHTIEII